MKKLQTWTLISLLCLLLFVSCTPETIPAGEPTEPTVNATPETNITTPEPNATTEDAGTIRLTPATTPEVEIVPTSKATAVVGEVPEEIMTAVYENLTAVQNVAQEDIVVTKAEATVWADGSLGCPQPNTSYTQEPVNGYWIVLEANGRIYDYRAAESGYFTLCQNNQPASPPVVGTPNS